MIILVLIAMKNTEECQPFPSPKQPEHREMR